MSMADDGFVVVKPTTRGHERRLTELERHRKMGHIGPAGDNGTNLKMMKMWSALTDAIIENG